MKMVDERRKEGMETGDEVGLSRVLVEQKFRRSQEISR